MSRRAHGHYTATNAEQLFGFTPATGRDVDIANFFARRTGETVDSEKLADLLAAYRVEQEERLEERFESLSDEVERLRDELADEEW